MECFLLLTQVGKYLCAYIERLEDAVLSLKWRFYAELGQSYVSRMSTSFFHMPAFWLSSQEYCGPYKPEFSSLPAKLLTASNNQPSWRSNTTQKSVLRIEWCLWGTEHGGYVLRSITQSSKPAFELQLHKLPAGKSGSPGEQLHNADLNVYFCWRWVWAAQWFGGVL